MLWKVGLASKPKMMLTLSDFDLIPVNSISHSTHSRYDWTLKYAASPWRQRIFIYNKFEVLQSV